MKIAFYINTLRHGGAERVISNLANFFCNDHEVIMVNTTKNEDEYPLCEKVKRIILEEEKASSNRVLRNIKLIGKLRTVCKNDKPDVFISFMAEPNIRMVIASIGLKRTKTIISVRNDPNKEYAGKITRIIAKNLLPLADGCVFQTEDAKNWFPEKLRKKSAIIYNAVREDFFNVERKPVRNRIVTVGRLNEQKNHAMLIKSFARIAEKYPDAQLWIYGEGSLRDDTEKLINDLALNNRVRLCGNTDNVPGVLTEADIFVLPSDYEGMPNALMEALAAGVPCISTDCPCGGPKALIKNGANGLLVPVNDEDNMVKSLELLLDNDAKKNSIAEKAHEYANCFKTEKINAEWIKYIEKICREG